MRWQRMLTVALGVVVLVTAAAADQSDDESKLRASRVRPEAPGGGSQEAEVKRADYALLIGTDTYPKWGEEGQLVNPIRDARAIGEELVQHYGFRTLRPTEVGGVLDFRGLTPTDSVHVLENPEVAQIRHALMACQTMEFGRYDQLLIFFAGHGAFDGVNGYVAGSDSKPAEDDESFESYLPHAVVLDLVDRSRCMHVFVVMDVCRGGSAFPEPPSQHWARTDAVRGPATAVRPAPVRAACDVFSRGLSPTSAVKDVSAQTALAAAANTDRWAIQLLERGVTRHCLTSGGREYDVPDGPPGAHSPFATRFIRALEQTRHDPEPILQATFIGFFFKGLTPLVQPAPFGRYNEAGSDFIFIAQ